MATDNVSLGRFILDGIPPATRGLPQIEVTFSIDANGILTVKAKDKATSKEQHITITNANKLTDEEIEKMKKEADEFADQDKKRAETIETRNKADSLVYSARKSMKELEEKADPDDLKAANDKIDELEKALRGHWDAEHEKPMTDKTYKTLIFPPFKQFLLGTQDSDGTRLGRTFGFLNETESGTFIRNTENSPPLPKAILAYALLDWAMEKQRQSVHLEKLLEAGGVGHIFRLAREDFDSLLVDIGEYYQKQVAWISHTAGLNSVSLMDCPALAMVSAYYHELDGEEPMDALAMGKNEVKKLIGQETSLFS